MEVKQIIEKVCTNRERLLNVLDQEKILLKERRVSVRNRNYYTETLSRRMEVFYFFAGLFPAYKRHGGIKHKKLCVNFRIALVAGGDDKSSAMRSH